MEYTKPPLTFEAQADLLLARGLKADRDQLIFRLSTINYYRLSAYLYPFRKADNQTFREGTSFELIWKHYTFDRQLRLIIMDAIERVEIAVRTQLIYHSCHEHGAFCHLNIETLPKINNEQFRKWLDDLKQETERSKETFISHFKDKYSDCHELPPLWMLGEIMTFGKMLTMFNAADNEICRSMACQYDIGDEVLRSWLGALNVVRNICAHHGRLWNRELGYKPMVPRKNKHPEWHLPVEVRNNRLFTVASILRYMQRRIAPTSGWSTRFRNLLQSYPEVSIKCMGFPDGWEECAIWSEE